ncbi:eCIS core domain-containing protein [Mastigocoleus testarum]|uniref:eCIS core domain-containing protein n=1 Tax=Mastigocoleus testarum BC008 TaxID=371196 RepID=A0A0V7ZW08_9CYAN|nr:DUF4157 domain-containing protein [Mastigocoleus testarum]KST68635.1 hypothetical protein BC008_33860 [Mastigocoleus testarum BC008]
MYRQKISKKSSPAAKWQQESNHINQFPPYSSLSTVVQRAQQDPNKVSGDEWEQLDSAIGTRATGKIFAGKETPWVPEYKGISNQLWGHVGNGSAPIQTKLNIGGVGDKYEQEADRVAASVVQQINHPATVSQAHDKMADGKEMQPKLGLRMKPMLQHRQPIGGGEASAELSGQINRARGGGQPLDTGLQQSIGQAMGADFSGVRVHTDKRADRLNQSLSSLAFTTGRDLFFKKGNYQPGSREGQRLIAHELAHVVQQKKQGNQQDNQRSNSSSIIQKKAYIGNEYRDYAEELDDKQGDDENSKKVAQIANDDITRRFKDTKELESYAQNQNDPSVDHIGLIETKNLTEKYQWIRVDQFTVLGENHGSPKAPTIIEAIGTKRFRYEGFSDYSSAINNSEFPEFIKEEETKKLERLGLTRDEENIHYVEGIIPKYARMMPDAMAIVKVQRGEKLNGKEQTNNKLPELTVGKEFGQGYNYLKGMLSGLKDALKLTQTLHTQNSTNNNKSKTKSPAGAFPEKISQFYGKNKKLIDQCIYQLEESLSNGRIPDLSQRNFPLTPNHLGQIKNIFVEGAKTELKMKYQRSRLAWKKQLDIKNRTDQQYTTEARELDLLRDASMYSYIQESKDSDLLFIIGYDHQTKLKPVLDKKNIKNMSDNDFMNEQRELNVDAKYGHPNVTELIKPKKEEYSNLWKRSGPLKLKELGSNLQEALNDDKVTAILPELRSPLKWGKVGDGDVRKLENIKEIYVDEKKIAVWGTADIDGKQLNIRIDEVDLKKELKKWT